MKRPLKIGARGSPLALAQARETEALLRAAYPALAADAAAVEIIPVKTSGDAIQDRTLADAGGKGLFTKEIEEALLSGAVDIAVHSAKDMPTRLPGGLVIGAVLAREDPRDVFIARDGAYTFTAREGVNTPGDLPPGAVIGTASLRRAAQALARWPQLTVQPLRGNVQTRLRKLHDGECDGTFLALAGLKRLGMADAAACIMAPEEMLPAAAQGAIALEIRADDAETRAAVEPLNHAESALCVAAERAFLAVLDGDCRTPIAAHATLRAGQVTFAGEILSPDGRVRHGAARTGPAAGAEALAREAGEQIKAEAGPGFLA